MHGTPLSDWLPLDEVEGEPYAYAERLPRTPLAEALVRRLLEVVPIGEGKMLGVLLVDSAYGPRVLLAYSGQVAPEGQWVPPIPFATPSSEAPTLARLEELKRQLAELPAAEVPTTSLAEFHRERKRDRDRRRALGESEEVLARESRADAREARALRESLKPLRRAAAEREERRLELLRERRRISRELQAELHRSFERSLFAGSAWSLASLFPSGPPTGVGECCAPRLLHYAAVHGLRPLAMAEAWHGPPPPGGGRRHGQLYGACAERCQPLIGPLLEGFRPLTVIYEDPRLLVIDKPPGVLSVPGRHPWNQDCVLNRLGVPDARPVHRLDLETSGVLIFARDPAAEAALRRQFETRTLEKTYAALLERRPPVDGAVLDHPLGPDPTRPGCYRLDPHGKWARTRFRFGNPCLFWPETGRSHQIRVHAAALLGAPIVGDTLYGTPGPRLHLHAWRIRLEHPDGFPLNLEAPLPFS